MSNTLESPRSDTFVGNWPAGERRTVTSRVAVAKNAVVRNYSLDALVSYRDSAGDRRSSERLRVGARPAAPQSFAVESVESTLRVDAEGEVRGVVCNTGDRRTTGDDHSVEVEVGPRRDTVTASPVDATFTVDSAGVLTVELTNTGEIAVSRVNARIVPTGPVESDDPATVVSDLASGETVTVRFQLTVTDDAIPKTTPVGLSVTYRTASGTPRIEQTTVPVEVVPQEGTGLPILPIAVIVLVLTGAGVWWWRRR